MPEKELRYDRSAAQKEFVEALEKDDFNAQYELLSRGTKNSDVAEALLVAVDQAVQEDGNPQPLNWETIHKRVRRIGSARRMIEAVTAPHVLAGRSWLIALAGLVAASAAASALLVEDLLEPIVNYQAFRGNIFLAVVCLGLMILSMIAFTTFPHDRLPPRRRLWQIVMACLSVGAVGMAATAVLVLVVVWRTSPPSLVQSLAGGIRQATVSPDTPLEIPIEWKQIGGITALASKADANLVVRLFDGRGREINHFAGTDSIYVPLRKDGPRVAMAEISASEVTRVTVSTIPIPR